FCSHLLQAVHQAPPTTKLISYKQYKKQANIEAPRLRKKMGDQLNTPGEIIAACLTSDGWTSKSMVNYRSIVLGAFQCRMSGSDFAQGALDQLRRFCISPKALVVLYFVIFSIYKYGITTDGASNTRWIWTSIRPWLTKMCRTNTFFLSMGNDEESDADVASDFEDSEDCTDSLADESLAEDSVVDESAEPTDIPQLEHVWCFCHRLHLIVTSVVYPKESTAISRMIERVRHVATKLRRSNSVSLYFIFDIILAIDVWPLPIHLQSALSSICASDGRAHSRCSSQLAGINFVVETDASKFTQLRSFSWRESGEILDPDEFLLYF
ncbi:hypothetical protein Ciccas_011303, partial [Cichlidogyrus casuarinus]